MFHHNVCTKTVVCEFCGKEFSVRKSVNQRFCSAECQHEWQKTNVGESNNRYRRVTHRCDYCGREHVIKRYKAKNENIFCSKECRQKWFAEVWSQREEWKEESRNRAADILSKNLISKTNTKPQEIVDGMLESMGIKYKREYKIGSFCIDNYLTDYDLYLEVMGDFWHASPIKYTFAKYEKQKVAIERDKRKCDFVYSKTGKRILYLWESDIYNNKQLCKSLICEYIHSDGDIKNYHSFNYHIDNDELKINEKITETIKCPNS